MSDPNAQVRKRQYMLIGGAAAGILGLMGAGMFLFDSTPASYREKPKTVTITAPGSLDDRDAWRAQQAAREKSNETLISEVKNQLRQQDDLIKKQAKELEDLKSGKSRLPGATDSTRPPRDGAVLQQPLPVQSAGQGGAGQRVLTPPTGPRPAGATATGAPLNAPLNQTIEPPKRQLEIIQFGTIGKGNNALNAGSPGGNTEVVGFPVDEKAKKYGTTQGTDSRRQIEFIPAGSFVRVAMLNGIDAPTGGQAQGNPLPVAFHVLDPANLPSKYKLDIKDCRVIGAAWGDLSSERSMIRLETLSCVLGNGETVEMAIKGQAIGGRRQGRLARAACHQARPASGQRLVCRRPVRHRPRLPAVRHDHQHQRPWHYADHRPRQGGAGRHRRRCRAGRHDARAVLPEGRRQALSRHRDRWGTNHRAACDQGRRLHRQG
jgi:conjugal transfer pilus assembly protein TraB